MTTPNMKSPEAYAAAIIENATRFTASLFLGTGEYANAEAATRPEIEAAAEKLVADHPAAKAKPILKAFDADGNQTVISGAGFNAKAKAKAKAKAEKAIKGPAAILADLGNAPTSATETARPKGKAPKAEKPAKPAKAPKAAAPEKHGKRAELLASAEAGVLPAKPDFSAATHARFRKRLDEIAALVEKGDIKALKAFPINPISSSPKAMDKYRNLAVIALEAQRKAAKSAPKATEAEGAESTAPAQG